MITPQFPRNQPQGDGLAGVRQLKRLRLRLAPHAPHEGPAGRQQRSRRRYRKLVNQMTKGAQLHL